MIALHERRPLRPVPRDAVAAAFLDIGMPRVHGYEVARRLRDQPGTAECVLVAVTGWGQEDDRQRAREAGFDRHLVKPADPADIETILKSY